MNVMYYYNEGEAYRVVSLTKKETLGDNSIEISEEIFEYLQNILSEYIVRFNSLSDISIASFILESLNVLEKEKQLSEFKIISIINERIGQKHSFYNFGFNILFNKLVSKGYFITEDNREEKFLEILETEDEELINILEKYLAMYDYLYGAYNLFMRAESAIEEIKHLNSVDDIYNLTNKYLQQISDGKFY
jgi:hypothetical protein